MPLTGGPAAIAYFTNDRVQRQTIANNRQTWTLDPTMRFRGWTTETKPATTWTLAASKTNHYGDASDSPTWISDMPVGGPTTITRNVSGISGDLAATTDTGTSIKLLLTTLHGDIGQQLALANPTTIDTAITPATFETDEYGNPKSGTTSGRYNWLGGEQRSTETVGNTLILMGARLYDATSGRFLTVDPVVGGNANAYEYCNADPVNCYDLDGLGFRSWWKKHRGNVLGAVAVLFTIGSFTPCGVICGGIASAAAGLDAVYAASDGEWLRFAMDIAAVASFGTARVFGAIRFKAGLRFAKSSGGRNVIRMARYYAGAYGRASAAKYLENWFGASGVLYGTNALYVSFTTKDDWLR